MKRLYVKINKKYVPISAVAFGDNFKDIKKTSIADAVAKYIELCTSQKCIKNQKCERLYFGKLLIYLNKQKIAYIDEVQRHHIDGFEFQLLTLIKPASVNRRFNTFKNFFRKCLEWKMIFENPCEGKKRKKEESNRRIAWSKEFYEDFLKTCDGQYKNIFLFLWLTGCRPIELINLRWSDIDYSGENIKLNCGKNSKGNRNFPMYPGLKKLLKSIKKESDYVFSIETITPSSDNIYQYAKHRLIRNGFPGHTPYGIRHGFGTRLAQAGLSPFYIAFLMGHASIQTTQQYIHSEKNQLIEALSKAS